MLTVQFTVEDGATCLTLDAKVSVLRLLDHIQLIYIFCLTRFPLSL